MSDLEWKRRPRSTGGESVRARARRLAEVALAGWAAHRAELEKISAVSGDPPEALDPIEVFTAGYLAALDDLP